MNARSPQIGSDASIIPKRSNLAQLKNLTQMFFLNFLHSIVVLITAQRLRSINLRLVFHLCISVKSTSAFRLSIVANILPIFQCCGSGMYMLFFDFQTSK